MSPSVPSRHLIKKNLKCILRHHNVTFAHIYLLVNSDFLLIIKHRNNKLTTARVHRRGKQCEVISTIKI